MPRMGLLEFNKAIVDATSDLVCAYCRSPVGQSVPEGPMKTPGPGIREAQCQIFGFRLGKLRRPAFIVRKRTKSIP